MKIAIVGCGLRTPLLMHGIATSDLPVEEIALYDISSERAVLMEVLGRELARDTPSLGIVSRQRLDHAVEGAQFVVSSIRPGGMEARARDERLAVNHGYAGQETTGPAGFAMALRTVPVAVEQAKVVERRAPGAWLVNFTNPAGLVTQAVLQHAHQRVIGICDTPAELFFRISFALAEPLDALEFDYIGLNHLGWVRQVLLRGADVTGRLLEDGHLLRQLYPAELFAPEFINTSRLIPTEYVFFYVAKSAALQNQLRAGVTRGEELLRLNNTLFSDLSAALKDNNAPAALAIYRSYLNLRNASYMKLEGFAESVQSLADPGWDPFEGATGYHRIAVEVMSALASPKPRRIVLNVANLGAAPDFAPGDVIEAPCLVNHNGAQPLAGAGFPPVVRGLAQAVKEYERLAIRAALDGSFNTACLALSVNPIVGEWARARKFLSAQLITQAPDDSGP